MKDENPVVDHLKKVTLALEAGSRPDRMDLTDIPLRQTFIFGVASGGITPFEKALFAHTVGDEETFDIQGHNAFETLGHLTAPLLAQLPVSPPFFLKARITGIAQAANREVIQAMAATLNDCGEGCDCGCGC